MNTIRAMHPVLGPIYLPVDKNNKALNDVAGIEPMSAAVIVLSAIVGLVGLDVLWRKVFRVRSLIGETVILVTRSGRIFEGNLDGVNIWNTQYTVDGHTVRSDSVSLMASKVRVDSGKELEIAEEQYLVAAITKEELFKVRKSTKEEATKRRDAEKERKAQLKGLPPAPLSKRGRQGEENRTFRLAKNAWAEYQLSLRKHGKKDEAITVAKAQKAFREAVDSRSPKKVLDDLSREVQQAHTAYKSTPYGAELILLDGAWKELQQQVEIGDRREEAAAEEKADAQKKKEGAPEQLEEATASAAS